MCVQVRSVPIRKDDEVQVVRGTFKVRQQQHLQEQHERAATAAHRSVFVWGLRCQSPHRLVQHLLPHFGSGAAVKLDVDSSRLHAQNAIRLPAICSCMRVLHAGSVAGGCTKLVSSTFSGLHAIWHRACLSCMPAMHTRQHRVSQQSWSLHARVTPLLMCIPPLCFAAGP